MDGCCKEGVVCLRYRGVVVVDSLRVILLEGRVTRVRE